MRLLLLLGLVGVVGFVLAVGMVGCGESVEGIETVTVTETVVETPSPPPTETEPPVPDDSGVTESEETEPDGKRVERRFGGVGVDGDIAFSVKGWRRVESVSQGQFSPTVRPAKGAAFVEVTVSYENRGKKAVSPFCGGQGATLIDEQDRNFDPDSDVAIFRPGSKICDDLQPGFKRTDVLVFEIPASAKENSVAVFNSSEDDDFLNESYVIFAP
jgi:hypothetical protein